MQITRKYALQRGKNYAGINLKAWSTEDWFHTKIKASATSEQHNGFTIIRKIIKNKAFCIVCKRSTEMGTNNALPFSFTYSN
jgi:hypothetical protein